MGLTDTAESDYIPIQEAPNGLVEWEVAAMGTPFVARNLVIRRRRQSRTATVVFFTEAVPGPIVPDRAVTDQPDCDDPPAHDAVSDNRIEPSPAGPAD